MMTRVSQVVWEIYWEYKILIPIYVSVSSPDRSEDLKEDQPRVEVAKTGPVAEVN